MVYITNIPFEIKNQKRRVYETRREKERKEKSVREMTRLREERKQKAKEKAGHFALLFAYVNIIFSVLGLALIK